MFTEDQVKQIADLEAEAVSILQHIHIYNSNAQKYIKSISLFLLINSFVVPCSI